MQQNITSRLISKRINQVMQNAIEKNQIVGSVVVVAKQGQIIYQQAAGYANREQQVAMTDNSIFLLSSVTKPIVTAAALYLVEQKILDLTAPITNYLPNFKPKLTNGQLSNITLHQLLTHTSGLGYRFFEPHGQGSYNTLQVSDGFDDIIISLEENLHRLSQAPLLYQPGESWCYSLSIDVLGAIMTAATGQTLEALISTSITKPLNMKDSGFNICDDKRLVVHYHDATPTPLPMPNSYQIQLPESWNNGILSFAPKRILNKDAYQSGGAGMAGSALDFMRFLLAITSSQSQFLSNPLIKTMAKLYVNSDIQAQGPGWGFGYGGAVLDDPVLACSPQGKGTLQWGGVYGHNWFYDPKQELTVVTFTNTAIEGMSGAYPTQIRDAVYGI